MLPLIQALALDVGDQRIFWIKSSSLHIIASSDYSGNDVRTVFRSCLFVKGMSASLAVLDQRVFWTNDDTLLSVAKNGSESVPRVRSLTGLVRRACGRCAGKSHTIKCLGPGDGFLIVFA